MKKSAFILSILMVCATLGMSQSYTFKVLASKGVTQVDNGSGWAVLKTGTKLNKNSKVKVSSGSYVGLMHSSGKTMELKSAGTYSVENLSGKLNNSKSSFTSKYASFVMNKMDASESGQSYNTTGSVSRGIEDFKVLAPKHIKMFKNVPVKLAWQRAEIEGGFVVSIVDLFNETYWSTETDGKSIEIDLTNVKVVEGTNYLIRVTSKAKPELIEEKPVMLIDANKEKVIINELAKFSSEIDQESPLDQLTMASFFEEKGLTIYALSSLAKAQELAPEVEDFETLRIQYYYTKANEK